MTRKVLLVVLTLVVIPAVLTTLLAGAAGSSFSWNDLLVSPHGGHASAGDTYVWHVEIVDTDGDVGQYTSIDLDSGDNPRVVYFAGELRYAYYDGTWHVQTADDTGTVVHDAMSLALDSGDNAHISYREFISNGVYDLS